MSKINTIRREFDTKLYPQEAVQRAAYGFTDRFDIRLEKRGRGRIEVRMTPKKGLTVRGDVCGELDNEVLHETLRWKVSKANAKIREYIVTRALVSAQVPSTVPARASSGEAADGPAPCLDGQVAVPVDPELEKEIEKLLAEVEKSGEGSDPLGVTATWEEKHGEKKL